MRISNILIRHLKNSNDKIIIPDKRGKPQVVLLSFAEYQKITKNQVFSKLSFKNQTSSLTNAEFLDKINADIQILKQRIEEQKLEDNFFIDEEEDFSSQDLDFNEESFDENEESFDKFDEQEDEYDPEEDRYYLEEI